MQVFPLSEIIALNQTKPQVCVRMWLSMYVHTQLYSFSQHILRDGGVKSPAATVLTYKWSFDSLLLTVN